ncbi:hypothetical protein [Acidianus sp. HS-5]|uniref:hypothetical protein n=1 Tax=Acidianus sp. HS-5 TaxID=2886040 RepID=UPI001F477C8C|nr:hypothetical protein [Acidianus sp. HS-5]BDC17409.1 hypothetical protein HS5_02990 [Acidianus sp. HS-5]
MIGISYISIAIGGLTLLGVFIGKWLDIASKPAFSFLEVTGTPAKILISNVQQDVIQCSARFVVDWGYFKMISRRSRLIAENAQGWVKLEGKHSSPAPWAYDYYYSMDIVGEESLVVLFLTKDRINDLENCKVIFPVRPINVQKWDRNNKVEFNYNGIENQELLIRVASYTANGTEKRYKLAEFVKQCINDYNHREDYRK